MSALSRIELAPRGEDATVNSATMRWLAGWRFLLLAVVGASLPTLFLIALLPSTAAAGDGPVYAFMAHHPFDTADQAGPYPFRILVPLVVWALPLPTEFAFHALGLLGFIAGATVTTVLARDIGVESWRALLAAPLYVLCFAGVFGVYQFEMIEPETAALTSGCLLLAWRGRRYSFTAVGVLAAAARDLGATVPLAWWAARRSRGRELRAILEAVAVGVPILATYVLIQVLVPHPPGNGFMQATRAVNLHGLSLLKFFVRSLVQGFGLLFLLWPIGIFLGSGRWKSFHLYVLGVLPLLWGTDWNRMTIYFLPFVLPSALLVLQRASYGICLTVAAASAYVAVILSLHNIPDSAGYPSGRAMLVPGALIGLAAALPAIRVALTEITGRLMTRSPARP